MTTHSTSPAARPMPILPLHLTRSALVGAFAVIVLVVLLGSFVRTMSSPHRPTSTPGEMRIPHPSPLPPVVQVPEQRPQEPGGPTRG